MNRIRHALRPDANDWKYKKPWSCSCGWEGSDKDVPAHVVAVSREYINTLGPPASL